MENQTINSLDVKTIGNFLINYYSDLLFMKKFRTEILRNGKTSFEYFDKDNNGSYMNFLISYGINRNFNKEYRKQSEKNERKEMIARDIFGGIKKFVHGLNKNGHKPKDVDTLVGILGKIKDDNNILITESKLVSLCSKTLFLYDPFYYPLDSQAATELKCKGKGYEIFHANAENYAKENEKKIMDLLSRIKNYTDIIENEFRGIFGNIEKIRFNRFVDKMLWTLGSRT